MTRGPGVRSGNRTTDKASNRPILSNMIPYETPYLLFAPDVRLAVQIRQAIEHAVHNFIEPFHLVHLGCWTQVLVCPYCSEGNR